MKDESRMKIGDTEKEEKLDRVNPKKESETMNLEKQPKRMNLKKEHNEKEQVFLFSMNKVIKFLGFYERSKQSEDWRY